MKFNKKLNASTLVEALVASVIIMIVFAVFSIIWISLMESYGKRISLTDDQLITQELYEYKTHHYELPVRTKLGNKSIHIELISKTKNSKTILISLQNNKEETIIKKIFVVNEYN